MKTSSQHSGAVGRLMAGLRNVSRGQRLRSERSLELLESLSLGGRRQLALVRCGKQEFLVGLGSDGVTSIVPARAEECGL